MSKCIYEFNGRIFSSESQLNDFLLSRKNLLDKYGDIVMSVKHTSAQLHTSDIVTDIEKKASKERKKRIKTLAALKRTYIEGETITEFEKNTKLLGISDFLNDLENSEGKLWIASFKPEEFWKRRFDNWKVGNFTQEEQEFFFGDGPVQAVISDDELLSMQKELMNNWAFQAQSGTDIHTAMQYLFSPIKKGSTTSKIEVLYNSENNITSLRSMTREKLAEGLKERIENKKKYTKKDDTANPYEKEPILNDQNYLELVEAALKIYDFFKKQWAPNPDDKLIFKTEMPALMGLPVDAFPDFKYLSGTIDLVVIDPKGRRHIIDYKSSPKPFKDFDSAKVNTYRYTLALYERMLVNGGSSNDGSTVGIIPFQLMHYKKNEENNYTFSGIELNDAVMVDYTDSILNSIKINDNLDEFFKTEEKTEIESTDDLRERHQEDMNMIFPKYIKDNSKTFTKEEIEEDLKRATQNDKGQYLFSLPNSKMKPLIADSLAELKEKIINLRESLYSRQERNTEQIRQALQEGIEEQDYRNMSLPEVGFHFTGVNKEHLKQRLRKYTDGNWELLQRTDLQSYGILVLRNTFTKEVDVIKITSRNLKYIYGKSEFKLLSQNLIDDGLEIEKNTEVPMAKAYQGNIEQIETLLILNRVQNILNDEYALNKIEVINPYQGESFSLGNEQLMYSFNRLIELQNLKFPQKKIENNFQKKKYKINTVLEQCQNEFATLLRNYKNGNTFSQYKKGAIRELDFYESIKDLNNGSFSVQEQIVELVKFRKKLTSLFTGIENNADLNDPVVSLFNRVNKAIGELQGLHYFQQVEDDKSYLKKQGNFIKTITNAQGLLIDNPGNLSNELLNQMAKMLMTSFGNIRKKMQKPTSEIRKLMKALREQHNVGSLKRKFANPTKLFENMIVVRDGDIYFKHLDELSGAEYDFVEYALIQINKTRTPGDSEIVIKNRLKENRDSDYKLPYIQAGISTKRALDENSIIDKGMNYFSKVFKSIQLWDAKARKESWGALLGSAKSFADKALQDEYETQSTTDDLYEYNSMIMLGEGEGRKEFIKRNGGTDIFERDLERLLVTFIQQWEYTKEMEKIFPSLQALDIHIQEEAALVNDSSRFETTRKYIYNYIRNKLQKKSINLEHMNESTSKVIAALQKITSICTLGCSLTQLVYQPLQGLWNGIALCINKPDFIGNKNAFTFKRFMKAFAFVYKDLFHFGTEPTLCQLLNERYGFNDMDMGSLASRLISSNSNYLYNPQHALFKFNSRPDFYNRLVIFVMQADYDGVIDLSNPSNSAYSVKNGELVYDIKKDKRFNLLLGPKQNTLEYNRQKSLFITIAKQFEKEQIVGKDGNQYIFKLDKYTLPDAYTSLEIENYKNISDDIYGYYDNERKSLVSSFAIGSMIMQMRTYWSGKKNQYMRNSGYGLQGRWEVIDGAFLEVDENGNVTGNVTEEDTGIPVIRWTKNMQQGIFSLALETKAASINPLKLVKGVPGKNASQKEKIVYYNLKKLWIDLLGTAIHFLIKWLALCELLEEMLGLDKNKPSDAFTISIIQTVNHSAELSFSDFWVGETLLSPILGFQPVSLSYLGNQADSYFRIFKAIFDNNEETDPGEMATHTVSKSLPLARSFTPMIDALYDYNFGD